VVTYVTEVDYMRSVSTIQTSNLIRQYDARGGQPSLSFSLVRDERSSFPASIQLGVKQDR